MPGHLTASAWVADPTGTEVLLTHHRKLRKWVQLGGHADGNADLRTVAETEALEEAGVKNLQPVSFAPVEDESSAWHVFDLDIHPIPPHGTVPAHLHFDIRFAFVAPVRSEPQVSYESFDVHWVKVSEINRYSDEVAMRRMAKKWRDFNLNGD